jgi:hypothetical protein
LRGGPQSPWGNGNSKNRELQMRLTLIDDYFPALNWEQRLGLLATWVKEIGR